MKASLISRGDRFGRLTTLARLEGRRWACICDCGAFTDPANHMLSSGRTRSCGCLGRELRRARGAEIAAKNLNSAARKAQRPLSKTTPIYRIWAAMIGRCHSPTHAGHHKYGARGITVCGRWRESFEAFQRDMGERPGPRYSIDRIDNDGHYCPENCRWATPKQQALNRRSSVRLTLGEVTQTMAEWAEQYGLPYDFIRTRINNGWPIEQALTLPKGRRRSVA